MSTQLQISAKTLGQLALADFCPRCFWVTMRCGGRLPFQIFPGVFSSLDSYQKRITNLHYERHHHIPNWCDGFGKLGRPIRVPHHSVFRIVDPATNILLTGVPDDIYRRSDGSLFIVDDKTAKFTGHQDKLFAMYKIQLNAYALIAEGIRLGKISGLGLIYHEPQTQIGLYDIDSVVEDDGFLMRFVARLLRVKLQPMMIPPPLEEVREICDLRVAPAGRDGCENCLRVNRLVEVAGSRL